MERLWTHAQVKDGETLPPFNPRAYCPKCGWLDIDTRHVPEDHPVTERCDRHCTAEHLERRCSRCYYRWPEAAGVDGPELETETLWDVAISRSAERRRQELTIRDPNQQGAPS